MSDSLLNILINAKDNASSVLKGLGGAMDKVKGQAQSLASSGLNQLNKGFEATANVIKGGVLLGFGAVTTAFGLFVKNTADLQQTRASFEGLIGSVSKTDELMRQLVETAKKTPLQFGDVAKQAENLLAFGVASEDVNEKMKMLGDVARGNAVKFGLLTNVYGQVKSAGKLMGQDLLQFTSQGIPLIDGLAQHFGVAKEKIKDMVSEGKVGFKDVDQVLQNLTASGGLFYKAMENQSKTLNGIVSNLTDSFFAFGRTLLGMDDAGNVKQGGIFWYLSQGAQGLLDKLNEINVQAIIDSIVASFQTAQAMIEPVFKFLQENPLILQSILVGLAGVISILVVGALVTMAAAALIAAAPFIALGLVISALYYAWQTNFGGIQTLTQQVIDYLTPSFQQLWTSIQALLVPLQALWDIVSPLIIPTLQILATVIGAAIVLAIQSTIETINIFIQIWTVVLNTILYFIEQSQIFWEKYGTGFKMIWEGLVTFMKGWIDLLVGIFTGNKEKIDKGFKQMVGGIEGIFTGIFEVIKTKTQETIDFIITKVTEAKNKLEELKNSASNAISNATGISKEQVSNGISTLGNSVAGALIPGYGAFNSIGKNATGTNDWRGGLTQVNEGGGEIINLPKGTQIIPNDISKEMAKNSGGNTFQFFITGENPETIAQKVSEILAQQYNAA